MYGSADFVFMTNGAQFCFLLMVSADYSGTCNSHDESLTQGVTTGPSVNTSIVVVIKLHRLANVKKVPGSCSADIQM